MSRDVREKKGAGDWVCMQRGCGKSKCMNVRGRSVLGEGMAWGGAKGRGRVTMGLLVDKDSGEVSMDVG